MMEEDEKKRKIRNLDEFTVLLKKSIFSLRTVFIVTNKG